MSALQARGRVDNDDADRRPGRAGAAPVAPSGEVVVACHGALDLVTVPGLRDRLAVGLEQHPERLVLDLSRCDFADCSAVNLLLDAHRAARRQGTLLVLPRPSPQVRRLLELVRLTSLLGTGPRHDR